MNWLDKENELKELEQLLAQELEEEQAPDWQQYANLKWRIRE